MTQIAEELGLSRATVSMVINKRSDAKARISEETRQRVLELAEKKNYRANDLARSVALGKTHMLGFLVYSDSYEPYWRTIVGAMEAASQAGYSVKILPTEDASLRAQLNRCVELRLSGIIARYDGQEQRQIIMDECRRFCIPLVFVDDAEAHSFGGRVFSLEKHGCELAVRHLIELGHERIAYLSTDFRVNVRGVLGLREDSFLEAMREAGLRFDPSLLARDGSDYHITGVEVDTSQGLAAVQKLLEHPEGPPTAIMTFLDHAAMAAVRAIRAHGLRVPEDVSVVGYSDFEMSRYFDPPLTTVVAPWSQMGRAAVEQLLEHMNKMDTPPSERPIMPSFVVRASTAPIST